MQYHHFTVHELDDVLVAKFESAKLFDALVVNDMQDELLGVIEKSRPKKLLIDFSGVIQCSTAVINSLLRAKKRLMALGGQIKLCSMHPVIREAYQLLNLDGTVFHIHDTQREAVTAFGYLDDRSAGDPTS